MCAHNLGHSIFAAGPKVIYRPRPTSTHTLPKKGSKCNSWVFLLGFELSSYNFFSPPSASSCMYLLQKVLSSNWLSTRIYNLRSDFLLAVFLLQKKSWPQRRRRRWLWTTYQRLCWRRGKTMSSGLSEGSCRCKRGLNATNLPIFSSKSPSNLSENTAIRLDRGFL